MPVSSRTSRWAACSAVSPASMWPLGSASTLLPSDARLRGTIATICSPRTTTPPAERSSARGGGALGASEDILLERLRVVHDQPAAALRDDARALEHGEEPAR